jgi:mRNA interferase RelE/StbE
MAYTIQIRRQAQKKLASLAAGERIASKIHALGANPDDPSLDTKKLAASPYWRLRVGSWRVIYDRQDALRIIAIEAIKPRGDAYK